MKRHFAFVVAAVLVAGVGLALLTRHRSEAQVRPVWQEVAWPFPTDQWGKGKAYRCKSADCGSDVALYLRPKLGSCDCAAGVADDDALDRMSDLDLLGGASPLGAGRPIVVGHMKGRSRPYALATAGQFPKDAISIAFNDRCDMIVATAVLRVRQAAREPDILEFLNSETVLRWVGKEIGL